MRIAMTVHKLPPESLGGTEIYARGLARALAGQGHDVAIFAPSPALTVEATTQEADGVWLNRVPLPESRATENPAAQFWHTFRDRAFEAAFGAFVERLAPDVVHFQHVQGVSARLIELARGRPRVVTLHDYWYFCANSQLVRPDRSPCAGPSAGCRNCVDCATARADLHALRYLRPLVALPLDYRNRYLARQIAGVDRLIAPSHFLREQYAGQGFPGERIMVLENGIDVERLKAQPASAPASATPVASLPRPHFGFLGSLAWQKGPHVLVDAFNRLPPDAASLTIYGSGAAFPDYAATLAAAVRHPNVRLAGALDYDNVGSALRQLDALIVPSLWYENSPLVIQEASAVGVPVIASRLGALAEKVRDGVTGRLFAPGDSAELADLLATICREPRVLEEWRANLVPPPSMPEHARAIAATYAELLAARSSAQ